MADGENLVSIRERLLKERHALLDLSTRNRLLNVPLRTRNNRAIEIVDEKAVEVFRTLSDGKSMTFLPGVQLSAEDRAELDEDDTETGGIPQPEDDKLDSSGKASRHTDLRLQTRLTSEGLQKRLFDVWYDAQTLEQEQGVNILYLAVGLLRWYDADNSELVRHAPLVLLPVQLERSSAADKFKLKWRDEPPSPNLTLQAKMKAEFSLIIEDFKDEDELDLAGYFARVAETVSSKPTWQVLPDAMVLGFFSFSKFLMYRDLDPDNWPAQDSIEDNALISALLRDGFEASEPLISDTAAIDDAIRPLELHHVVDADSSQTVAIAEAAGGRTLVIKGPPGTGKSQTITNIIAAAAARGKKVLFVSEKMAALDVVHRRLKAVGLGPLTLELHSNKINKRAVLEELKRTRDGALRPARGDLTVIQRLTDTTETLNTFAGRLHAPLLPSGIAPQRLLGRLAKWEEAGRPGEGLALPTAGDWSTEDVVSRRAIAVELAERSRDLGPIPQHPWRGVGADAFDPAERDQVVTVIKEVDANLQTALAQGAKASLHFGAPDVKVLGDLQTASDYLQLSTVPSRVDRSALAHPGWRQPKTISALLDAGRRLADLRTQARGVFNDTGLSAPYGAIREDLVVKSRNLFRFLDGAFKRNIALLRSYVTGVLPATPEDRLRIVDLAIALQTAETDFSALARHGEVFGRRWDGASSDWTELTAIADWRFDQPDLPEATWSKLAMMGDAEVVAADQAREVLSVSLKGFTDAYARVVRQLALSDPQIDPSGAVEVSALQTRLAGWMGHVEALSRFIAFAARGRALAAMGVGTVVEAIHRGDLQGPDIVSAFDGAYTNVLRGELFKAWPELKAFDGENQNRLVTQFRQLDTARIELAKEQIALQHGEGRPKGAAGIGPLGVLNAEMAKKRSHLPIRLLLEKAGPAIQQLKPVFMMSPLSVAQFLKPGTLDFDLLVMDEASQIEPVDALGAIARVKQLVVVGDERQLPPTSFFKKLTGEEEPEDDDAITIQAKDAESILDLCLAKGVPHRMLSWHYRSKHQSLIAVSNREFYENRLFIVPSPYDAVAGMGLKFHLMRDTFYERGGTRTNPLEAKRVAEAVIAHVRQFPEQSLGVATFSVSQRQCILKELELMRRAHPELEEHFSASRNEPFFVKNLENIQGDERDVIFISVGYGKTKEGYLAHSFGPLSGEGGERRLNVLISRAKIRCEVFCNFTGGDIDLERTRSRGVAALKLFLTFAETGHFGQGEALDADYDSEFEQQVCERLTALGYDVKAQIGASGFRVDLAVADPDKPGRFVLGIECDGVQYHSSRSARDRDRLRQQVLEAHGWIIHRIWSADWYLRPSEELKKVEDAIAAARAEWRERDEEGYRAQQAVPVSFEFHQDGEGDVVTPVVGAVAAVDARMPYLEASFPVNLSVEPHDVPSGLMADYVLKIVEAEGPIHEDEVATRIRMLWGLQRAGNRIRGVVASAVRLNVARGLIKAEGEFYSLPDQEVAVRDRSQVASASLRKSDMLPPAEIQAAIRKVITENFGASRSELAMAVSRLFGFAATSAQLKGVIDQEIDTLLENGTLAEKNGLIGFVA
ncbi:DUF3320 domain-containing protein [Asticcacaulis taihuensis]|nr:DUF3320 domain-containing protein [Asticcacaulis taihuensis]